MPDIIPGDYLLRLTYTPTGFQLLPEVPVTITAGGAATHTFDVSGVMGIVSGTVTVNDAPPGADNTYEVCGSLATIDLICELDLGADGRFALLLPTGSGSGFVRSSTNARVATFSFNVTAGQTTEVGNPINQSPTVSAGGSYSVVEGGSVELAGTGEDPDGEALTYAWDLDGDGTFETAGQTVTFSAEGQDGPASVTVTLQVCDPEQACAEADAIVEISNADPVISSVANDGPGAQGSSFTIVIDAADPGGAGDPLTYEADCDEDGTYEVGPGAEAQLACTYADDGEYVVGVRVTDDDDGVATGSTTVVVENAAATLLLTGAPTVAEGSVYGVTLSTSDPGTDTVTEWVVDWGDGTSEVVAGSDAISSHVYADGPANHTVTAAATDEDGTFDAPPLAVTVENVTPVVEVSAGVVPVEGGTFAGGVFTDPGTDSWTATVDYGDGSAVEALALNADGSFALGHAYVDDGSYPVTVAVTDDDGATGVGSVVVEVANAAPVVTAMYGLTHPLGPQGTAEISAEFTDAGVLDTHTAEVDWGDGTVSAGTVTESGGFGTVAASHVYRAGGTYVVTMTVFDDDGAAGQGVFEAVQITGPPADPGPPSNPGPRAIRQCLMSMRVRLIRGRRKRRKHWPSRRPSRAASRRRAELEERRASVAGGIQTTPSDTTGLPRACARRSLASSYLYEWSV